ncbi:MAG TPA: sulfur carrier protein ThiS [Cytophagaceae bacterium]|jgi:sulfur carrier protein|nr:sulfur carrier protein ThiS [Cytophagaceae bacterium]
MNVFVNNEKREILNQQTITQLLGEIQLNSPKGIAVAINNEVIPKSGWEKYWLNENDKVTIIRATQGG